MGIFDKLRGAVDEKSRVIANDLGRLNAIESGLGDKAINYVLRGEDETCLSTIHAKVPSDDLVMGQYGWNTKKEILYRQRFIFRDRDTSPEILARYAEVLATPPLTEDNWVSGSKKVPMHIRLFFTDLFRSADDNSAAWDKYRARQDKEFKKEKRPDMTGFSLERALEIIEAMGGTLVDFFDLLLQDTDQYYYVKSDAYIKFIDFKAFALANLPAVLEAGARIHAAGRATLIGYLSIWKVTNEPNVIDFLMKEAGSGAKQVRERATACLAEAPAELIETKAIELLTSGNASVRAGMVPLLGSMRTEAAMTALKERLEIEKTAKVKAAIQAVFTVAQVAEQLDETPDDENSYLAVDGTRVEIPQFKPLPEFGEQRFGEEDKKVLRRTINEINAKDKKRVEEQKAAGNKWARHYGINQNIADAIVELFNGRRTKALENIWRLNNIINENAAIKSWVDKAFTKLESHQKVQVGFLVQDNAVSAIEQGYYQDTSVFRTEVDEWFSGPEGDFRQFLAWQGSQVKYGYGRVEYNSDKGKAALQHFLAANYYRSEALDNELRADSLWPFIAQHMDVLDEAFGLKTFTGPDLSKLQAVKVLRYLPKLPMRYFGPVLEVATGTSKRAREYAQSLLGDVEGVDERLIGLLDDGRQAVRAGVAEWLGVRGTQDALPAFKARLKKEKSELAKAAILTAMEKLGADLSDYIGPNALIKEAEKSMKKAKFDKLDWLSFSTIGEVRFKNGKLVPEDVLKSWIFQAFKLKQPGGNTLFELYLDQLEPESAERFSGWVFNSWISYDVAVASDEEANAYAKEHLPARWKQHQQWLKNMRNNKYYQDSAWFNEMQAYTEETIFGNLKREIQSQYLHSGAATKGVLGLATRAPAVPRADLVRNFLKKHGARTSQATALLELLAASGDPVSLQVVISASTRLKQKGVQARAGELLEEVAEQKNWTMDELADRTIPTAGFEDNGVLELPCTPIEKMYTAILDDHLKLIVRNPDGKTIKSLPSGDDDFTKASKKALSAAKKEVKQVVTMQSERLYEALCAERSWAVEDWQRDFRGHPLMLQLVQRLVWLGVDEEGEILSSFRPTAEGELINHEDDEVELEDVARIRLAHGALVDTDISSAWVDHLKDYEVKPLFQQFGRDLKTVEGDDENLLEVTDRRGWFTDSYTIRGAATKLGYERGQAEDGGWFTEYSKSFKSAGLKAVIEFTGCMLPEENIPASLQDFYFEKLSRRGYGTGKVKLGDVPPVLLSECWNDYHDIAAKAKFDPEWEKKSGW